MAGIENKGSLVENALQQQQTLYTKLVRDVVTPPTSALPDLSASGLHRIDFNTGEQREFYGKALLSQLRQIIERGRFSDFSQSQIAAANRADLIEVVTYMLANKHVNMSYITEHKEQVKQEDYIVARRTMASFVRDFFGSESGLLVSDRIQVALILPRLYAAYASFRKEEERDEQGKISPDFLDPTREARLKQSDDARSYLNQLPIDLRHTYIAALTYDSIAKLRNYERILQQDNFPIRVAPENMDEKEYQEARFSVAKHVQDIFNQLPPYYVEEFLQQADYHALLRALIKYTHEDNNKDRLLGK